MKKKRALFPQANKVDLLFEVYSTFPMDGLLKEDIKLSYGIDVRQGAYYLDALVFLDLLKKMGPLYLPTINLTVFKKIKSITERKEWFCNRILENQFISTLLLPGKDGKKIVVASDEIVSKIQQEYALSNSTARRRAQCILSWLEWVRSNSDGVLGNE